MNAFDAITLFLKIQVRSFSKLMVLDTNFKEFSRFVSLIKTISHDRRFASDLLNKLRDGTMIETHLGMLYFLKIYFNSMDLYLMDRILNDILTIINASLSNYVGEELV